VNNYSKNTYTGDLFATQTYRSKKETDVFTKETDVSATENNNSKHSHTGDLPTTQSYRSIKETISTKETYVSTNYERDLYIYN